MEHRARSRKINAVSQIIGARKDESPPVLK